MNKLVVGLILNICLVGAVYAQTVAKHGQLSVKGTFLTDQHNQVVVLQGV